MSMPKNSIREHVNKSTNFIHFNIQLDHLITSILLSQKSTRFHSYILIRINNQFEA